MERPAPLSQPQEDDDEVYPAPSQTTLLVLLLALVPTVMLHRPRMSGRSEQFAERGHLGPTRLAHADLPVFPNTKTISPYAGYNTKNEDSQP